MRQSGIQEVQGVQELFILLSLLFLSGGAPWGQLAGGAAFGAALSVHYGSLLVAPACLYMLYSRNREPGVAGRIRASVRFFAPQLLLGAAITAWLVWAFRSAERPVAEVLVYLRGIAPLPTTLTLGGALGSAYSIVETLFGCVACGWPLAAALVAAIGAAHALRESPTATLVWVVFPLPYLLYIGMVGVPDPLAHMTFLAPPLAFFAAAGMELPARLVQRLRYSSRGSVAWFAMTVCGGAAILGSLSAFYLIGLQRLWKEAPREAYRRYSAEPLIAASRWINESLPTDVVVVQPRRVPNVNRLASEHLRRPIIFQEGRYFLLRTYRRWTPMNLSSYAPLTTELLERLLREGTRVVAFDHDLARQYGVRATPAPPSWGAPMPLFVLALPR
jgi:hypothetical protein